MVLGGNVKSDNGLHFDQMMVNLPLAKSDAEIEVEYGTLLVKAMSSYRHVMRQAKMGEAARKTTELIVSLKRRLASNLPHVVECSNTSVGWTDSLVPAFDEHKRGTFATRGLGDHVQSIAFTKPGYGCSLSFSLGDFNAESATMRLELLSTDGSMLQPFELTVMDADTNEFYLKRAIIYNLKEKGMTMKPGNYIIVARNDAHVVTLRQCIE